MLTCIKDLNTKTRHERNSELYNLVKSGNEQAREELIELNMPLVTLRVDSFLRRHPRLAYLRDDLQSAGFLALVQAVNKMAEYVAPPIGNPTGYISVAITRELGKVAEKESTQGFSQTPTDRQLNPLPAVLHGVPGLVEDQMSGDMQKVMDTQEMLDSCYESDDDRTILRMRKEGHSDREIADALNIPHTATYTLRKELEQRFQQKCRELEEE